MAKISKICAVGFFIAFLLKMVYVIAILEPLIKYGFDRSDNWFVYYSFFRALTYLFISLFCYSFAKVLENET